MRDINLQHIVGVRFIKFTPLTCISWRSRAATSNTVMMYRSNGPTCSVRRSCIHVYDLHYGSSSVHILFSYEHILLQSEIKRFEFSYSAHEYKVVGSTLSRRHGWFSYSWKNGGRCLVLYTKYLRHNSCVCFIFIEITLSQSFPTACLLLLSWLSQDQYPSLFFWIVWVVLIFMYIYFLSIL